MRCPYCGGINADYAAFCVHCGRDLKVRPNQQPPRQPQAQPQHQPPRGPDYPPPVQPAQQPYSAPGRAPATSQRAPANPQQASTPGRRASAAPPVQTPAPAAPQAPEPPAPFPPQTMEQLQALQAGALAYTVTETSTAGGRKKSISITYPRCAGWQQVATLLKAYHEQQEANFATIIVAGYWRQEPDIYSFTNGQMIVDRGVPLGSQKLNRYQIETGNGLDSDTLRIVIAEPV